MVIREGTVGSRVAGCRAYFDKARFEGGTVRFSDLRFAGGAVSFGQVDFGSDLVNFKRAKFGGASVAFRGAKFRAAQVSFAEAKFTGGTVVFGSASGPIAPGTAGPGSIVSFENATGVPGVVDLGDLQTRVREVIAPGGQAPTQPDPFG